MGSLLGAHYINFYKVVAKFQFIWIKTKLGCNVTNMPYKSWL